MYLHRVAIRPLKSGSNWNLETLVFEERGKPEYPVKIFSGHTYINKGRPGKSSHCKKRETHACLKPGPWSCFAGLTVVRKLSRPSRKASRSRVSFGDRMQWTPRKCDETKEKMAPKEIPSSSSLSSDSNSNGVFNKGFYVSVLDLYSDDESNDTSRVVKEPVPITKATDVSVENENALFSKTETINQPNINSGNTDCTFPQEEWKSSIISLTKS